MAALAIRGRRMRPACCTWSGRPPRSGARLGRRTGRRRLGLGVVQHQGLNGQVDSRPRWVRVARLLDVHLFTWCKSGRR